MERGLKNTQAILHPYTKKWDEWFASDCNELREILHDFDIQYEHCGSTAVVGLCAKPVINITLAVKGDRPEDVEKCIRSNGQKYGYRISPYSRDFIETEIRGQKTINGLNIADVPITPYKSESYNQKVSFRDFLNEFPTVRDEYAALKLQSSAENPNARHLYTQHKKEWCRVTTQRAMKYYGVPHEWRDLTRPDLLIRDSFDK